MNDAPDVIVGDKADLKEPEAKAAKALAKKAETVRRNIESRRKSPMKRVKKVSCKPASRRAQGRPFPYERVAKLWAMGRTLTEISLAIGTFNSRSDDPCHRLRVALTAMHRGWKDSNGKLHKLPHRVKKSSLAASRRAGKKASA